MKLIFSFQTHFHSHDKKTFCPSRENTQASNRNAHSGVSRSGSLCSHSVKLSLCYPLSCLHFLATERVYMNTLYLSTPILNYFLVDKFALFCKIVFMRGSKVTTSLFRFGGFPSSLSFSPGTSYNPRRLSGGKSWGFLF